MKLLDLIAVLWYTKDVNNLNTGTGVSTEVTLPSGSSEAIHVGSSPVVRTNKMSTALAVVLVLFIRTVGLEIGRKLRSNLCEAPNSLVDCLSAKAATGGSPVVRTMRDGAVSLR